MVTDVFDHGAGVDDVEGGVLGRTARDVVGAHFEVGAAVTVDEACVQIGGDDSAGCADLVGQPQRHRPGTTPDLQATPTLGHAKLGEEAGRST